MFVVSSTNVFKTASGDNATVIVIVVTLFASIFIEVIILLNINLTLSCYFLFDSAIMFMILLP